MVTAQAAWELLPMVQLRLLLLALWRYWWLEHAALGSMPAAAVASGLPLVPEAP